MELCDKIKNQVLTERERASGLMNTNKIKLESSLIKLDNNNITKVYSPRGVTNDRDNRSLRESRGFSPPRSKLNDA